MIDGERLVGCPREHIQPDAYDMISAHHAYEHGHTPVTLGRDEWTPLVYTEGVELVRAAIAEATRLAARAAAVRRRG